MKISKKETKTCNCKCHTKRPCYDCYEKGCNLKTCDCKCHSKKSCSDCYKKECLLLNQPKAITHSKKSIQFSVYLENISKFIKSLMDDPKKARELLRNGIIIFFGIILLKEFLAVIMK